MEARTLCDRCGEGVRGWVNHYGHGQLCHRCDMELYTCYPVHGVRGYPAVPVYALREDGDGEGSLYTVAVQAIQQAIHDALNPTGGYGGPGGAQSPQDEK
jgi:hypothetical protein